MCKQKDIDRYKRIVAVCFADGLNLNQEMVRSGWAIAYKLQREIFKGFIVSDELFAKNNKLGMLKGTFVKPKDWRKQNN